MQTEIHIHINLAVADSALAIRKYHHNSHDYPKFAVFVPGEGFKVFQCLRDTRGPGPPKLVLDQINAVLFKVRIRNGLIFL